MSRWSNFYGSRINSTYQNYFDKKYGELLEIVNVYNTVREEGIGIGSISKHLIKKGVNVTGFDLCPDMLRLCQLNNPELKLRKGNIFHSSNDKVDIVVTHGVLEHFSDTEITSILNRYKCDNQKSVHYVPLNGYKVPSFGDERLLPYQHWVEQFNPTDYFVKNNEDLILIFE